MCAGSALHWTVRDTSNYETYLDKITLDGAKTLTVRQGQTTIVVPFKNVKTLTIHADESITYDRELYYMVELELKSGDIIGTEQTASEKTYIRATGSVSGSMGKNAVRLNVNQIASITLE
jgi:hypothetical protein